MNKTYYVTIPTEDIVKYRDNKQFILILRLARFINTVRFSWQITKDYIKNSTPAASRQQTQAFLYMCALLYEFFKNIYDDLEKEFKDYQSFKDGLLKIKNDPERIILHSTLFNHIRDKIEFHFDMDVISTGLFGYLEDNKNTESLIFGASHSDETLDMYYNVADELTLSYLKSLSPQESDFLSDFKKAAKKVSELSVKINRASDELIADVLNNIGFKIEETKNE
ncbi:hypothetical protein ACFL6H_06050 [Candidatus Latescibacterota bacterium]